ncbi:hypothetical protein [uncultured Parasphingopyxis sp.]|uniref:hypothetical protein n=1 Tax=uncultured Parasphingopyxis sp. TaxID=1547918 RepID=UPI00263046BF|nr:hypothetical protein [uncultured Parasphingopyxis sp.]
MAMARPARPAAELVALREAAVIVEMETDKSKAHALGTEIARRVVEELRRDLASDPDDRLSAALTELERNVAPSPFVTLATCPEIDVHGDYMKMRRERLEARSGQYLSPEGQCVELAAILDRIERRLSQRYIRQLRA